MPSIEDAKLTAQERTALDEFVTTLRKQYGSEVSLIRLFGSKARGEADAESDIDLLVVVNHRLRRHWDGIVALETELMLKYGAVLSALILDREEYRWHQRHSAPLYRTVEREGVDLWTSTPGS